MPPRPGQDKTQEIESKAALPWDPHRITCVAKSSEMREIEVEAHTRTPKAMIFNMHSIENMDVKTIFRHFSISSYSYGAS